MALNEICITEEYGGATGYVVGSKEEQVSNYLSKFSESSSQIAEWLKAHCRKVAILKNLSVNEGERDKGYGNELLERFITISKALDERVDAVILIADKGLKLLSE